MGHERPHRLVLGEGLVHGLADDRLAVWRLDHRHAFWLRIQRICRQLLLGRCLHANGEAVNAGEGAVRKGHHLVTRQDQGQHAIEPREAYGAGHAVGVDVLGAPQLAQHLLGLDHAAQHIFLHVVGHAGLGEPLEHAGDPCSLALGQQQAFQGCQAADISS